MQGRRKQSGHGQTTFQSKCRQMLSEHLFIQNFQGGACPQTPLEQVCITDGPLLLCFRRVLYVVYIFFFIHLLLGALLVVDRVLTTMLSGITACRRISSSSSILYLLFTGF